MNRNWLKYNEQLIQRGSIYVNRACLAHSSKELKNMNRGKVGGRYRYPDTLITVMAWVHLYFGLPYRQTCGLFQSYLGSEYAVPHYTTINRRINRLQLDLIPKNASLPHNKGDDIVIVVDSTGIKVTNSGEWLKHKHKDSVVRRGYIKIHAAVDKESKYVVSLKITDESVHDSQEIIPLVEEAEEQVILQQSEQQKLWKAKEKEQEESSRDRNAPTQSTNILETQKTIIKKVYADGAYDSGTIYQQLYQLNITPVIPVRSNSRRDTKNKIRRIAVNHQKDLGYTEWSSKHAYGQRWQVEAVFSAFKRMFGEHVMAHKRENMFHEIYLKVALYNRMVFAV